jgi:hypothetical protein
VKVAEASRQYQLALEHERRGRTELAGILSGEPELQAAAAETGHCHAQLFEAMFDAEPSA